jgi:hypothetical protein
LGRSCCAVKKLNMEANAVLADAKRQVGRAWLGSGARVDQTAEFGKFIADETGKWAKGVKFAGIKAD